MLGRQLKSRITAIQSTEELITAVTETWEKLMTVATSCEGNTCYWKNKTYNFSCSLNV